MRSCKVAFLLTVFFHEPTTGDAEESPKLEGKQASEPISASCKSYSFKDSWKNSQATGQACKKYCFKRLWDPSWFMWIKKSGFSQILQKMTLGAWKWSLHGTTWLPNIGGAWWCQTAKPTNLCLILFGEKIPCNPSLDDFLSVVLVLNFKTKLLKIDWDGMPVLKSTSDFRGVL